MTPDQEQLVLDNRRIVSRVAAKLKCLLPRHIEEAELVGAGNLGLVKAALRFDPVHGVPFAAYAGLRIRGEMLDHLRSNGRVSRADREAGIPEAVVVSFDAPIDATHVLGDIIWDDRPEPGSDAEAADTERAICGILEVRDRRIIEMLCDGFEQRTIAAILGVSNAWICHLVARIREKIASEVMGIAS